MSNTYLGPPLILLDRDGTIIRNRADLCNPDTVELLEGAEDGLYLLSNANCRLAIVTNQSGVGRGQFSVSDVEAIHAILLTSLAKKGIRIDMVVACYHSEDAGCTCRKPAPGLAIQVAHDLGVSLLNSFVIGDQASDMGLANAIGASGILVAPNPRVAPYLGQMATVSNLKSAALVVLNGMLAADSNSSIRERRDG